MHEASVTEGIFDTALQAVEDNHLTEPVKAVHVTIGVTQGLIPESMQMFWEMIRPDTPLAQAELVLHVQPMVAYCPACQIERQLDAPVLFCPDCGGPMEMIKGKELVVTSIEVEDASDSR